MREWAVLILLSRYFFMPLSSVYSFQKSAGVIAHMFRAVAMVISLAAYSSSGLCYIVTSVHRRTQVPLTHGNLKVAMFLLKELAFLKKNFKCTFILCV